jgi:hypothetical protein
MLSGVSLLLGVIGQSQATMEMVHTGLSKKVGEKKKEKKRFLPLKVFF